MRINTSSIQFKLQGIIWAGAISTCLFFLVSGYYQTTAQIRASEQKRMVELTGLQEVTQKRQIADLEAQLSLIVSNPELIGALRTGDKASIEELKSACNDIFNAENSTQKVVTIFTGNEELFMQIPDGQSQEVTGLVDQVIKNNSTVSGFEQGLSGLALSVAMPVREDNQILGIVICSADYSKALEDVYTSLNTQFYIGFSSPSSRSQSSKGDLKGLTFNQLENFWQPGDLAALLESGSVRDFKRHGVWKFAQVSTFTLINQDSQAAMMLSRDVSTLLEHQFKHVKTQFLVVFLLILLICAGITYFLRSNLFVPLIETVQYAKRLRDGDYTKDISRKHKDELGALTHMLNQLTTVTAQSLGKMSRNGQRLKDSSQGLLTISSELTGGTRDLNHQNQLMENEMNNLNHTLKAITQKGDETQTSLEVIASASEEMSSTIQEISRNTENARNEFEIVQQHVKQANTRVQDLGTAAQAISQVVDAIVEIAEQTKLLALNATIEASRAGEAGKGFSVVADEIKELANQTNKATTDISNRIKLIQDSTNLTVKDIAHIQDVFGGVLDQVTNIAAAVEEQAVTTREMAGNIQLASDNVTSVSHSIKDVDKVSKMLESTVEDATQLGSEMFTQGQVVFKNATRFSQIGKGFLTLSEQFKLDTKLTDIQSTEESDLITWGDDLELGIALIDQQHLGLVHLINNLYWSIRGNMGSGALESILHELITYTEFHFSSEERMMEKAEYPKLKTHKKSHENLINQVQDFNQKLVRNEVNIDQDLMEFLKDWLVNHIKKEDRQYQADLKKAGY